ncbi:MAG: hypothetical protein KatS3mg085_092 [Candidatus Dojkabacteria bacterium]|nr:MAG: hypothetical protein KatS3mg085_092 [Candidatus Dojkabacteria bacterium]
MKEKLRQNQGREAQEVGKRAEERVKEIAKAMGFTVEASPDLDYGAKTDVLLKFKINEIEINIALQVCRQPKSKREQKRLAKKGIFMIAAGKQISDFKIKAQISEIFNDKFQEFYEKFGKNFYNWKEIRAGSGGNASKRESSRQHELALEP